MKKGKWKNQYVQNMPPLVEIMKGTLYISLKHNLVEFYCPCNCGDIVSIPVGGKKGWSLSLSEKKKNEYIPSLSPSIKSRRCGSHFWIRNNKTVWA